MPENSKDIRATTGETVVANRASHTPITLLGCAQVQVQMQQAMTTNRSTCASGDENVAARGTTSTFAHRYSNDNPHLPTRVPIGLYGSTDLPPSLCGNLLSGDNSFYFC